MIITEKKKLHLLGRPSSLAIKKVSPHTESRKNYEWFFVDYAPAFFNLNESFDIFIGDDSIGSDWNHKYKIKLVKVIDEFGREHDKIPEGYKTVCRFEFSPHIPSMIKRLPITSGWGVTDNGVHLLQHSSIDLLSFDRNSNEVYSLLVSMIAEKIRNNKLTEFSKEQFGVLFLGDLSNNIRLRENLIHRLIYDGLLEKEENNKLLVA
jgi:hypothetical protein